MIDARTARAQVTAYKNLTALEQAQAALARIELMPAATRELSRRIDNVVKVYITATIGPAIEEAASTGNTQARFSPALWSRQWNTGLNNVIDAEFGAPSGWYRCDRALFEPTSLQQHRLAYYQGGRRSIDVSMYFHVLYRAGMQLHAVGFNVTQPTVSLKDGCKVEQEFTPLVVDW